MWVLVQVGGLSQIAPVGQESLAAPQLTRGTPGAVVLGGTGTHSVMLLGENEGKSTPNSAVGWQ